jgi:hypothetical protein
MSAASDRYEKLIASSIDNIPGLSAKQGTNVKYSDVLIAKGNKKTWLEVKMNHTDNLSNPRVFYMNNKWQTTYTTPAAKETVSLLNKSNEAQAFIKAIAKYSGIPEKSIIIGTNKSHLKLPGCVQLETMKSYFAQPGINRYILKNENYDIGGLVTKHYLEGKAEPAHYLQAKDDFYRIGNDDPFRLGSHIPALKGKGDFKVRVSTRSEFYEVQAEIKITKMIPENSPYSVHPDTKKKNPFLK